MEYDIPESTSSFFEAFSYNYMIQHARFAKFPDGRKFRHIFNSNVKGTLLKGQRTILSNIEIQEFNQYETFKYKVQNLKNEIAKDLLYFVIETLKENGKNHLLLSEEEGCKEINPNSRNLLENISNYFSVTIFIYENNSKQPLIFQQDQSKKPIVCLDYSNNKFTSTRLPDIELSEENILKPPYFFIQAITPVIKDIGPEDILKKTNALLSLLVQAADLNKNFMSDEERKNIIDALMFDDRHITTRNKLINVKVCSHKGKYGVFTCQHYHCYLCLKDEMEANRNNLQEIKCPCSKPISEIDMNIAQI